jgi:hypothetical protein
MAVNSPRFRSEITVPLALRYNSGTALLSRTVPETYGNPRKDTIFYLESTHS